MPRLLRTAPRTAGATPRSFRRRRGSISESESGACVQVDSYDLERLRDAVEYRDNVTNLTATTLPVPASI